MNHFHFERIDCEELAQRLGQLEGDAALVGASAAQNQP
jgi:hypothetical protein